MRSSLRTVLGLSLLLISCWCLASWIRLKALHGTTAGSDTPDSIGRLEPGSWCLAQSPEPRSRTQLVADRLAPHPMGEFLEHLFELRFILGAQWRLAAASLPTQSPRTHSLDRRNTGWNPIGTGPRFGGHIDHLISWIWRSRMGGLAT